MGFRRTEGRQLDNGHPPGEGFRDGIEKIGGTGTGNDETPDTPPVTVDSHTQGRKQAGLELTLVQRNLVRIEPKEQIGIAQDDVAVAQFFQIMDAPTIRQLAQ